MKRHWLHTLTTRHAFRLVTVIGIALCAAPTPTTAQQPAGSVREIIQLRGDLYRVRADNQYGTVFLVTPAGIILGDPISVSFSTWLKGELTTRFPNRPVRYVIVSHHDFDHASGAKVFDDTAEIVGHELFNAELAKAKLKLSGGNATRDRNGDQVIDREEVRGTPFSGFVDAQDRNGDGRVTPAEIFQDVIPVERTYKDRDTITLGGKTVNLVYTGQWHAADMTAVHFPAERTVFAVDYPQINDAPLFIVPSAQDHIRGARIVESIDFDILVPGHGEPGTRSDVTTYREYVEELLTGVQAGIKAGQTLEQVQAGVSLAKYASWPNFATRKNTNIANVYADLQARSATPR